MQISCQLCGASYPTSSIPFRCDKCGGTYEIQDFPSYDPMKIDTRKKGVHRFQGIFGSSVCIEDVSLGEGNTPLIPVNFQKKQLMFKCEHLNPTGSYKDRGSVALVSFLKDRNVTEVIEDSSGNAGVSLSAYTSKAGIKATIYIPESTSVIKKKQIQAYGSDLQIIHGTRTDAAEAVIKAASQGSVYASHAYMPFGLSGIATTSWEIFEELGEPPGSIICPVGHGGALLGMYYGFMALRKSNRLKKMPLMCGVQTRACAPISEAFSSGEEVSPTRIKHPTVAEGICVGAPVRGQTLLNLCRVEGGRFYFAEEKEIMGSLKELAEEGFFVEPTSAVVWPVLKRHIHDFPEPIVIILTGSGLKYMP